MTIRIGSLVRHRRTGRIGRVGALSCGGDGLDIVEVIIPDSKWVAYFWSADIEVID